MKRKDNFRMVLGNIGDVIYIDICYVLKFLFKDYKIKSHHISFQNQEIIINIKLENAEVNFAYDGCNRLGFIVTYNNCPKNIVYNSQNGICNISYNANFYYFTFLLDEDFVANLTTMYLTNATLDAAKFKTYPINISDLKDIYQENVLKEIFNNPYLLIERVEKIKDSTSKSSDIHSFGTDYKKYHEKYKNDYMPCDYRRKRHL